MTQFAIASEKCTDCGACQRACPAGAVNGSSTEPHSIDPTTCIACGSCREACKFGAVMTQRRPA